ncbi:hypothetical protein AC579_3801 [Pseudocercospora musae]|uniref:Heterokaryon incompatibility domain-containing protein n=1 Tax=Pseudocercospora musae TaxID=113226 RepID=A0A139I007_9PEZI|nr:hypothetical protein AC579_3801 [Pseudocercospora musae]
MLERTLFTALGVLVALRRTPTGLSIRQVSLKTIESIAQWSARKNRPTLLIQNASTQCLLAELRRVLRLGATDVCYAVAHVGEREEVTFHNMNGYDRGKNKTGYSRIRTLYEQARQDGFGHAWIDTCCVDKSSSAELSEAINSMFKWYEAASVCYAYLSVVTGGGLALLSDTDYRTELGNEHPRAFAKSKRFRLGWTLQELLAPEKLIFYGHGRKLLGSVLDCACFVSATTTIPFVSRKKSLRYDRFGVVQRMSWAAS